jgi:protein O-GlcNAc transferase
VSQELFDEAVRLEEQGQYERALAIWRQLAEIKPTRNLFLRLGRITQSLGLTDDAERAFKLALEIDGRSAKALQSLGIIAIRRSDYEAAVSYLKQAREIEEDPGGLSLLGVALRNTGKDLEAEEAYRSAIRIDPKYEEAYYNLGALLRDDRPSEAQAHLRKALELDPVLAPAHRELGFVLMARGTDPETERHLRKAVELGPDDVWAHIYLGAYLWGPDTGAAETEFRIAEKLRPEWSMPLSWLGKIYESRDLDTAQSFFEQALQLEADDWEALCGLARIFKRRGQTDLAREYVTRALLQDPSDEKSLALLKKING